MKIFLTSGLLFVCNTSAESRGAGKGASHCPNYGQTGRPKSGLLSPTTSSGSAGNPGKFVGLESIGRVTERRKTPGCSSLRSFVCEALPEAMKEVAVAGGSQTDICSVWGNKTTEANEQKPLLMQLVD